VLFVGCWVIVNFLWHLELCIEWCCERI